MPVNNKIVRPPARRRVSLRAIPALVAFALLTVAAGCLGEGEEQGRTVLSIRVTDGPSGPPIPARVALFDEYGDPVHFGTLDMFDGIRQSLGFCHLGPGAIGTWDGIIVGDGTAEIAVGEAGCIGVDIPFGHYRAWVWRGIEYHRFEADLDLTTGRGIVSLDAPLERVFEPAGALAADLHVHALGSGDSLVPAEVRVLAQAAAGIDVIGATEHNLNSTFEDAIVSLEMSAIIACVPGNEVSAPLAHFGVYPVDVRPSDLRGGAPSSEDIERLSAAELMAMMRALPERPVIQLNHPRFGYAALFDAAAWDGESWPPPFPLDFDAVETLGGFTAFNEPGDRRLDQSVIDFYTLIDNGILVTALGNSDTHHLNWVLDGTTRSYVFVRDTSLASFDRDEFADAIRARRAIATTGPWLDVEAGNVGPGEIAAADGGALEVAIELAQANFVKARRLRILVGGVERVVLDIPEGATSLSWTGMLEVGSDDTWLAVDASGEDVLPIEMTGSYQVERGRRGVVPFALINPILIDSDGDGLIDFAARRARGGADVAAISGPYACPCEAR